MIGRLFGGTSGSDVPPMRRGRKVGLISDPHPHPPPLGMLLTALSASHRRPILTAISVGGGRAGGREGGRAGGREGA